MRAGRLPELVREEVLSPIRQPSPYRCISLIPHDDHGRGYVYDFVDRDKCALIVGGPRGETCLKLVDD